MADANPRVAALKKGFGRFAQADMHALSDSYADDIEWIVPGRSPLSRTYRGKVEVFSFFGNLIRETGGTWRNELIDAMATDRYSVAILRVTASRGDKRLDQRCVALFDLDPGTGKIKRAVFLIEDQDAWDELFR